ncbi:MAG: hypothetical protein M1142_00350 [Patescibacteria group bacterium]|nr:hypothetical protein [Patescibacteria group bacterium]
MKRLRQEENNKPKKKVWKAFKVFIAIFLVVLFIEIFMANRLSTYGDKIQQLKDAQASLELENQVLENQIARQSSLISVETKSSKLGFETVKNFEYINPTADIASAM